MRFRSDDQTEHEFHEVSTDVTKMMQTVYEATFRDGKIIQGKISVRPFYEVTNYILTFHNNGTKKEEISYGDDNCRVMRFDESGEYTELEIYDSGVLTTKSFRVHDENGLTLENINVTQDGTWLRKQKYKYNDTGQYTEMINYSNQGGEEVMILKNVFNYRDDIKKMSNGKLYRELISNYEYDAKGDMVRSKINKFNKKGQVIETVTYYADPKMKSWNGSSKSSYNDNGDLIEETTYDKDGKLKYTQKFTHKYDKNGNEIFPDHFSGKKHPLETETLEQKDSRGNWIKKITYFDKAPDKIYIRELVYDGEEKEFEHPLSKIVNKEEETVKGPSDDERFELEEEEAKWLVEGANASPENFSNLRYYSMTFKSHPSVISIQTSNIEAIALYKKLKKDIHGVEIHSYTTIRSSGEERMHRYSLRFTSFWGYILHAINITAQNKDEFMPLSGISKDDDNVYTSQFQLLRPSDASCDRDENFEGYLANLIRQCTLRKKPDKPFINIIEVDGGEYSVAEYAVNDNFIIKDLDVNYGQGFEQFHKELMQRFNSSTKGLVLFHGIPGTGKTYYIRHLLRTMVANHKQVIYIPPNMVDHLVDPSFMTFISAELKHWAEQGHSCVLLIEDAEPLLAKRQEGVRIQGVTNLLNMTDGLLNDMLNIQIICTFNVDVRKLDSALLRPGRLIARKEFKALSLLDTNLLAQRLGIKHHFTKPGTLGEIYGMQANHNTLIHEVDTDKGASTTIDDLF